MGVSLRRESARRIETVKSPAADFQLGERNPPIHCRRAIRAETPKLPELRSIWPEFDLVERGPLRRLASKAKEPTGPAGLLARSIASSEERDDVDASEYGRVNSHDRL